MAPPQTSPPTSTPGFESHHVVDGAHVAHVVGEQAAHLLLPPVSGGVQGRPPVRVPAVHVHVALQQHPAPQEEEEEEEPREDGDGRAPHLLAQLRATVLLGEKKGRSHFRTSM